MKILITAGPTREALDPVRFLSNRSSGKMGYAIAGAAVAAGHEVTLVSGPVGLAPPDSLVDFVPVTSASDMFAAVAARLLKMDVAIFAAAVADYRPLTVAPEKIKKTGETLTLELVRTPDILGSAREPLGFKGLLVGFAAETENLRAHALAKLHRKGCDLMVANDVGQQGIGFDSDANAVTVFFEDGREVVLETQSKHALAQTLIALLTNKTP